MDANNTPQSEPARTPQPGSPHRPMQPIGRRPMIDGFVSRRPMPPSAPGAPNVAQPRHTRPHLPGYTTVTPQHRPTLQQPAATPQPHPVPQPQRIQVASAAPAPAPVAVPRPIQSDFVGAPRLTVAPATIPQQTPTRTDEQATSSARPPREKNRTGHAGWVGFIVFILLGALLLSPFLPGRIIQNFPFASNTFSTGDSALECINTPGQLRASTKYNTKAGTPITYTYTTSTTQTATCNGQEQSAVIGHTSQFNPLGLVVDVAAALVAAIVVSRIWRLIFGEKRYKPRNHDD